LAKHTRNPYQIPAKNKGQDDTKTLACLSLIETFSQQLAFGPLTKVDICKNKENERQKKIYIHKLSAHLSGKEKRLRSRKIWLE